MENKFDRRPWGTFTVLDVGSDYKVKRLEVLPKKRLSYQKHERRSEHWFIVRGKGKITLNGVKKLVKKGDFVDISAGMAHQIENPDHTESLVFIEVQTGDYFGEDDIVRIKDDFGRASE